MPVALFGKDIYGTPYLNIISDKYSFLVFQASLYMTNVESSHCQPLPEDKFKIELLNQFPSKL